MLVCIRSPHEHGGSVVDNYDEPCQRDIAPRGEITGTAPAPSMVVASDLSGRASCTAKSARLGSVKTTTSRDIREKPHNSGFGGLGDPSNQELVRAAGVEPAPPFGERILSPLRLPISPRPQTPLFQYLIPIWDYGLLNMPVFLVANHCNTIQRIFNEFQLPPVPSFEASIRRDGQGRFARSATSCAATSHSATLRRSAGAT